MVDSLVFCGDYHFNMLVEGRRDLYASSSTKMRKLVSAALIKDARHTSWICPCFCSFGQQRFETSELLLVDCYRSVRKYNCNCTSYLIWNLSHNAVHVVEGFLWSAFLCMKILRHVLLTSWSVPSFFGPGCRKMLLHLTKAWLPSWQIQW